MNSIRIDTNVPLPGNEYSSGYTKYPFKSMKVGHSFAVPKKAAPHLKGYVYKVSERMNRKFVCRALKEGNMEVLRVWRVA